ncbi:hypothetical protein [Devosia sp.]|uniref:hypothetical protein n=1 Tax=Devosia sp. TaxID=1871048 RepID=UPI0019F5D91A|nr:hypothetical protein [Devosia sp.]MBE0580069.1 hypothetical protein [Devosia sp.]
MVDYLYYDDRRLDSYIEQFASPVTFDKFAEWTASLSLAGPNGEGKQTGHARPLTKHEKVEEVTQFLVDKDLVQGRPCGRQRELAFVDDTFSARRFFIPKHNIAIWMSKPAKAPTVSHNDFQVTYFIEDYTQRGNHEGPPSRYSGYSGLYLLSEELERGNKEPLRDLWDEPETGKLAFIRDPIGFFTKVGAHVGPTQNIRTVYKFRASSTDLDHPDGYVLCVIGYPLWIERA